MKIGEFARELGVSAPTVRFYESLGLVAPARRISGARRYDQSALHRLRIVLALKRVGFSLVEIKGLLASLEAPGARERWQRAANAKLAAIGEQIAELRSVSKTLKQSFDCDCAGRTDRCTVVSLVEESDSIRRSGEAKRGGGRRGFRAELKVPPAPDRR